MEVAKVTLKAQKEIHNKTEDKRYALDFALFGGSSTEYAFFQISSSVPREKVTSFVFLCFIIYLLVYSFPFFHRHLSSIRVESFFILNPNHNSVKKEKKQKSLAWDLNDA